MCAPIPIVLGQFFRFLYPAGLVEGPNRESWKEFWSERYVGPLFPNVI